ncbi:hypothetical protein I7I53_10133 [Histoplasma capsulatum var. duboisii H88]|uniref:Uncharacterized protein n=2 Tax=Ajellomyces capsulatus (strain H88) TaxID=544711 RepID=A0A8A1LCF3_AJEC8|nr:hypothetical protein I7I53_10133 [Histoplasma capsulatum var. duboisii H88]
MTWRVQPEEILEQNSNPSEAMNQVNRRETAEKRVSDMMRDAEGYHLYNEGDRELLLKYGNNTDINPGNGFKEEPKPTYETTEGTHNAVLSNRTTKFTGTADARRLWSAAHEKELKRCLLEDRKCPMEWDANDPRFAHMVKLMEKKEAHDEFTRHRSFHEMNEGWMYRTITSERIKARKAMPMGFYHITANENSPNNHKHED